MARCWTRKSWAKCLQTSRLPRSPVWYRIWQWWMLKNRGFAINPRPPKPRTLQHLHHTEESCGTLQLGLTELVGKCWQVQCLCSSALLESSRCSYFCPTFFHVENSRINKQLSFHVCCSCQKRCNKKTRAMYKPRNTVYHFRSYTSVHHRAVYTYGALHHKKFW